MANGKNDTPKRAKADHAILDAAGNVTDEMEKAAGTRYVHLGTRETLDVMLADLPQVTRDMLACFGFKTLATNEASQARQAGDDEMIGIRDRLDVLKTGVWAKERDGVGGVVIDRDVLADAAIAVMLANGEIEDDAAAAARQQIREGLDEPATLKFVRQVDGVQAEYDRRTNKTKRSTADLAALLRKSS